MHRTLVLALVATALIPTAYAAPNWVVSDTSYTFDAPTQELTATCAGVTFRPLHGIGLRLSSENHELAPTGLRLVASKFEQQKLICTYEASFGPAGTVQYQLEIAPRKDDLAVRISSASNKIARVTPGATQSLGKWFRFGYTRHAEPYGQQFWPMVAMGAVTPPSPEPRPEGAAKERGAGGVRLCATWDMSVSNGSSWDAPDQRFSGEGDFAAGVDVLYAPRTDGSRMPLDETLALRIGTDLWSVIPKLAQKPSEYAKDLSEEVFLDVWGGKADETEYFMRHMAAITGGKARFYTVFEDWQAGGFDSLLPDSIIMPDYPPNPGIGSIDEFQSLSRYARTLGRFGLRTNYVYLRDASPSAKAGKAVAALDSAGKKQWFTRPSDWMPLARRQETEIANLFATNAAFTDQLGSAGCPWGYTDYDAKQPNAGAMRESMRQQREFLRYLKDIHKGPIGSETLIDETQIGEFMDTGDFGIFDGYDRAFTPEFKLRRIQQRTTTHGMGLMYRYFEMPPFKLFSTGKDPSLSAPEFFDDYRASEILYGNGGYLFYYPNMRWDYVVTECALVGNLQRYYALQPVRSVGYWREGRWQSLSEIVAAGVNPLPNPWVKNEGLDCLRRIRVEYGNGLQVIVNRLAEEFPVQVGGQSIVLPKSGWVAWLPGGKLLAYSAYYPGTKHRVDFLRDEATALQYLDPRGEAILGETKLTLWRGGKVAARVDPKTGDAWVDGQVRKYEPPHSKPVTKLDFRFDKSTQGWVAQSCFGRFAVKGEALEAEITGDDPYMYAPPISLAPDSVKTVVVRVSITCGKMGQFYFAAEGEKASAEEMCVHFDLTPDGQMHDVRIPVGDNPHWRGHRITSLRFDPEHGASPGVVRIESMRGE